MTPRPTLRQRERETPAERRLHHLRYSVMLAVDAAAIDIGREAIALLREPVLSEDKWLAKVRALLTRAREEGLWQRRS